MNLASQKFELSIRVYIEDTDIGGIVYYANYLKFFERARTEFVRSIGFELRGGYGDGISYVVHSLDLRYFKPAKLDQILRVTAAIKKVGKAHLDFVQKVLDESGDVLVEGNVRVACVNLESGRPRVLPPALVQCLTE